MINGDAQAFSVVNYSLVLNSFLWTRKDAARIILYYAVDREAHKINVSDFDAYKQIAFFYARHRHCLPTAIVGELDDIEGFDDASGEGFDGWHYKAESTIDILTTYCSEHPEFFDLCRNWFRFYISWSGDAKFDLMFDSNKFDYLTTLRPLFPPF